MKRKISKQRIRRMIARAAWSDKQWAHRFWSEHNLQRARGYIDCLRDIGAVTPLEACEYYNLIYRLILKINKML